MRSLIASIFVAVHTLAIVAFAAHTPYTRISQAGPGPSFVPQDTNSFTSADVVDVSAITFPSTSEASKLSAADMSILPLGPEGNVLSATSMVTVLPSSTSYQNHPGIEPPKTTPLPATPSFAAAPVVACWSSSPCTRVLGDFAAAYQVSGDITDPNERGVNGGTDQSRVFQARFCGNTNYQDVLSVPDNITSPATPMKGCLQCFNDAGLDTTSQHTPSMDFVWEIYNFCHTDQPSLFYLLEQLLAWMKTFDAPARIDNMPAELTAVVDSLVKQFTFTPGMNSARDGPVTYATDGPASLWWQTKLTANGPIPTEYLAQVPSNWPYTEYGIARKAGKTTSWPFVNPNATSQTVAWLYHSMLWNPRPLFTPKAERAALKGSMYNPALRNWTHSFLYETVPYTIPASTTNAHDSAASSFTRTPVSPSISQSSVMPEEADSDAEIRASVALSRSLAEKSKTASKSASVMMQVTEAPAISNASSKTPDDTMLGIFSSLVESIRDVFGWEGEDDHGSGGVR